ncbi:hypothetical protein Smp_056770 [Schistosoma mansoni]|uniref:hypothetical protein n=1 Tax=Schistosoma mansoni TaxID=6183 RepID=UPI00022C86F1|nr:hypothetical protein Smp_056770 [Schistosoma mansoni]|eukprot:XP_018646260.1 hypothetical protein Smp_056770 [Schistosoma mansoni]
MTLARADIYSSTIKELVKIAIHPGSDGGLCEVIFTKAIIILTGGGLLYGIQAALPVKFLYSNEYKLNIDSIINHLKTNYDRYNKISFIRIIRLKVNVTISTIVEKQERREEEKVFKEEATSVNVTEGGEEEGERMTETEAETTIHPLPPSTKEASESELKSKVAKDPL